MKNKLFLLILLILCFSVVFAACDEPSTPDLPPEPHIHGYQWLDNGDGTHVQHCINDGCDLPDINAGTHEWGVDDVCVCGATKPTDYNPVEPHTHNYQWINNGDGTHFQHCMNNNCPNPDVNFGNHALEVVDSGLGNCIEAEWTTYQCLACKYSYTVTDDSSVRGSHTYQAYVCVYCQQDEMLDYVDYFSTHGASEKKPIVVNSREELTLYIDYVYLSDNYDTIKFIDIAYVDADINTEEGQILLDAEFKAAINAKTAGSFYSYTAGFVSPIPYLLFYIGDNPQSAASIPPTDWGYGEWIYPQTYSPAFEQYESMRASDFDDFAYTQRTRQISVSTSDQLFYAFEHGYMPVPVAGSVAQRMLNKAKYVARRIMDDRMTDVEKLRAIYLWLVEDVYYDYGALYSTVSDWHVFTAYYLEGVFDYGMAVCDGISKAYCVLAGLENITCVRVTGEIANGGGGHAWNKVLVDVDGDGTKEWFVSDATWANTLFEIGNEQSIEMLNLSFFLTTDSERMQRMAAVFNYLDCDCEAITTVNPFEYFFYGGEISDENDFVIENRAELIALFQYIATQVAQSGNAVDVCFNVYVYNSYCTTKQAFEAEVQFALSATNLSAQCLYSFNNSIGTIHLNFDAS